MKTSQKFFDHFIRLYRPFEGRRNVLLSEHGLYRAQWTVLYYIRNYGSATLVELAAYQGVEKPTMSRTIHRLVELGYLETTPTQDRREKKMQLTALGKEQYEKVRVALDAFEESILEGVSEEELEEAIQMMIDIRNRITEK